MMHIRNGRINEWRSIEYGSIAWLEVHGFGACIAFWPRELNIVYIFFRLMAVLTLLPCVIQWVQCLYDNVALLQALYFISKIYCKLIYSSSKHLVIPERPHVYVSPPLRYEFV